MTLIVCSDPQHPTRGTLTCGAKTYPCALGRGGVLTHKIEGDGATPIGTFALRQLFYRADRLALPLTKIPTRAIQQHDGWCDAPSDENYNQLVSMPYSASVENLWRDDRVYDLIVVMGYNDAPVVPGKGSAIFMHIATPDYAPTAGCVALSQSDLLAVLKSLPEHPAITIEK
jgi:L,D-peptidoglycan transpeptidase YkuD (ErfK/YbiS/YcfS/YnhG family)